MEKQQVEQTAKSFESQVREGKTDRFAEQLHNMPEADRKAIVQQIKADAQKSPDYLPNLTFTDNGELKSSDSYGDSDRVDHETKSTHSEYDNGKLKTIDTQNFDASSDHYSFDSNGNQISNDKTAANGDKEHDTYDSATHKQISAHIDFANGDKEDDKFNRNSGNKETADLTHADGSTDHADFDRSGNFILKSHSKKADGTQIDAIYDDRTTDPTFVDVTAPSGAVNHFHYDPKTQTLQQLPHALKN
ncbi:MAG: hypothetical protein P4L53_12460 [Candidatus Obscuribacterales bacterium]|nr:hypothetical protein [Candidatus Obscuribacterales bacterium]